MSRFNLDAVACDAATVARLCAAIRAGDIPRARNEQPETPTLEQYFAIEDACRFANGRYGCVLSPRMFLPDGDK